MVLHKLPIGIQSFSEIRTGGYAYVDKTPFLADLVSSGKYYFLSRPRRFGKSLFLDTLACAFSGQRDLFNGLYLGSDTACWDFSMCYPILRIDHAGGTTKTADDLVQRLHRLLNSWEEEFTIERTEGSPGERLLYIVKDIALRTKKKVVILIDEYDKPILDNLEDTAVALKMRDILKDFYSSIKPLDEYLHFVFLTGVSRFSKTGIFSGLNNLNDITLDEKFSQLCGYTQRDLETVFSDYISQFDSDAVKKWYNGYSWTGESVYNPFDILLLFSKKIYRSYWFETGTPTFLITLWQKNPRLPAEYDGLVAGDDLLRSFEPERIRTESLLFQAGYLTIKSWSSDPVRGFWCTLGYPNNEVRISFNSLFSEFLCGYDPNPLRDTVYDILESGEPSQLKPVFHSLFAAIPHDWYRNNPVSRYEGYYASVVYTFFASLGYEVIPEDTSNKGRIDITVKTKSAIWVFEFKVRGMNKSLDSSPLLQIKNRGYLEKYAMDTRQKIAVGVIFEPKERNIEHYEYEVV